MFVYGKITESIEVLRAGLKKYPDSYILMENLAFHLESDEQMENHNEEIISLYKKVLEGPLTRSSKTEFKATCVEHMHATSDMKKPKHWLSKFRN